VDGFSVYDDGPYFSVNWTDSGILQSAISAGPVKIGVAADQIEAAWHTTGGRSGWFAKGFHADSNEDHCVALCGYGSISWLAQQLHVSVPAGVDGAQPGYAMFTWDSIGIIDRASMIAVTHEAWLRQPTTVTKSVMAVPAAMGSPLAGFPISGSAPRAYYLDALRHVEELGWVNHWSHGDVTGQCSAPPAVAGSALAGYERVAGEPRVCYLDAGGHLHELRWGGRWLHADLSAIAGATTPAVHGSSLSAFKVGGGDPRYYYLDGTGRVQEISWWGNAWHALDVTTHSSA
jgi:hypothetical protein